MDDAERTLMAVTLVAKDARMTLAADIIDAWGQAIRNDWSTIDGRSCKMEMAAISAYLRGETDLLTYGMAGVCRCPRDPRGHWHDDLNTFDGRCPEIADDGS